MDTINFRQFYIAPISSFTDLLLVSTLPVYVFLLPQRWWTLGYTAIGNNDFFQISMYELYQNVLLLAALLRDFQIISTAVLASTKIAVFGIQRRLFKLNHMEQIGISRWICLRTTTSSEFIQYGWTWQANLGNNCTSPCIAPRNFMSWILISMLDGRSVCVTWTMKSNLSACRIFLG